VFTGYAWTGRLLSAGTRLSYALHGPRGNPEMESFLGGFKVEDRLLILDAGSLEELAAVVGDRPPLKIIEDFYREGLSSTISPEIRCPTLGVISEGEGPGEFRRPNDIVRGPDGTIGVLDGRLLRMSLFSRRGEHQLAGGYNDRAGGLIFVTCYGEFLVRYADRTAPQPSGIVRSTYVGRYATEEDVAAELGVLDARRSGGFCPNVSAEDIRAEPSVWYGGRLVDDRSRFWAVSHWNWSDEVLYDESYIDMYRLTDDGLTFGVTLQIADKTFALDVLGDTLTVFVMRDNRRRRTGVRVDWYDVSEYK